MAESEEALQLKRRARRRLVGAVALVTFVVIILPLLLDKEPGPAGPPLDVQIPKQEAGGFSARIGPPAALPPVGTAPAPEKKTESNLLKVEPPVVKSEAPPDKAAPPTVKTEPPVVNGEPSAAKTAPVRAAPKVAEKAALNAAPAPDKMQPPPAKAASPNEAWVVALDAFSDANNVKQLRTRLSAAGVKSYTEPVKTSKGELTRVRAGPFPSREAAEKARARLEAMGLKPGAVASR